MHAAFYHATGASADALVPPLAARALAAGHRVLVRCSDRARLEALDRALWTFEPASFLPHGLAGGEHDARQPCLLAYDEAPPANGADLLILMEPPLPADGFVRVLLVFDEATLAPARAAWKAWAGPATYWRQGAQGWEKAATKP